MFCFTSTVASSPGSPPTCEKVTRGCRALKWSALHIPSKTSYSLTSDVYAHMIKSTRLPSSFTFSRVGGEPGDEATSTVSQFLAKVIYDCKFVDHVIENDDIISDNISP